MRTTAVVTQPSTKKSETAPKSAAKVPRNTSSKETKERDDIPTSASAASAADTTASASASATATEDISGIELLPEKTPTKISTVIEHGIAFIENVAPGIVDNLVIGDTPIVPIAVELIEWAENNLMTGKLTGQEKKRIVIHLLLWTIDHEDIVLNGVLGDKKETMRDFVEKVMPSMIDTIIAATKGKIMINQFSKVSKSCLSLCCP